MNATIELGAFCELNILDVAKVDKSGEGAFLKFLRLGGNQKSNVSEVGVDIKDTFLCMIQNCHCCRNLISSPIGGG
jgi:hypothetical protein